MAGFHCKVVKGLNESFGSASYAVLQRPQVTETERSEAQLSLRKSTIVDGPPVSDVGDDS